MLKIRLSRTGKNRQPSFRVVVQEHTAPIKGRFVESVGLYRPTTPEKDFTIDNERVKYWISVGARPSDTVATLLKKQGFEGMEQYMEPRDKKRAKKKDQPEASASAASTSSEKKVEAKKEEPAAASKDAQPETAAVSEVPAPASENAKAEEAPVPEAAPTPEVPAEATEAPAPEAAAEPEATPTEESPKS